MNKESLYYMTLGGCCALQFLAAVTLLFIVEIDTTTRVWTVILAVVLLFTAWSCWKA